MCSNHFVGRKRIKSDPLQVSSSAMQVVADPNLFDRIQSFNSGYPHFIKDFQKKKNCKYPQKLLEMALRGRNWEVANWIGTNQRFEHHYFTPWEDIWGAAMEFPISMYQSMDIILWLHNNLNSRFQYWKNCMDAAAGAANLPLLRFLHENRAEGCTTKAMDGAAENGHLEVVEFLHYHRIEGCTTVAMDRAAMNGHLDVVKFLHFNRSEGCTTWALYDAVEAGHVEIVKFLCRYRDEGMLETALEIAQEANHPEIVEFLSEIPSEYI